MLLARQVGEHDDVGLLLALARLALDHRVDRNMLVGEDARDVGEHARLVGDGQTQVVAGLHLGHRQDRRVHQRIGLECQVRHAVFGIGGVHAGDIDQIGDHRRCRRLGARALAVVERGADGVALHQDGVHRALDIGDQAPTWDQGRMHAQFYAVRAIQGNPLGDAEQLDAIAELFGILDVDRVEPGYPLDMHLVELHRNAEGDRRHDGELVGGIDAFDVEGRIGLGIAQALRSREHGRKGQTLVAHLGKDEVGGAVDDAGDPLNAVGGEPFAQCFDDRDAAGHCGLEGHHHALLLRRREDLVAMRCQQRLVGGHHMLAVIDGRKHQFAGYAAAADQLDHDIDVGIGDDRDGVVGDDRPALGDLPRQLEVLVGDLADAYGPAGAAGNLALVAQQNVEGAAADSADAEQAYVDWFHSVKSGEELQEIRQARLERRTA